MQISVLVIGSALLAAAGIYLDPPAWVLVIGGIWVASIRTIPGPLLWAVAAIVLYPPTIVAVALMLPVTLTIAGWRKIKAKRALNRRGVAS